jgi:hypothetical protein
VDDTVNNVAVIASEARQSIFELRSLIFGKEVWLGTMDCRASLAVTG